LFIYNDIWAAGARRWLRMSASFERAIQPLIFVADNPGSFKSQILQTALRRCRRYLLAMPPRLAGRSCQWQLSS
jgi:hypothetical protein